MDFVVAVLFFAATGLVSFLIFSNWDSRAAAATQKPMRKPRKPRAPKPPSDPTLPSAPAV